MMNTISNLLLSYWQPGDKQWCTSWAKPWPGFYLRCNR